MLPHTLPHTPPKPFLSVYTAPSTQCSTKLAPHPPSQLTHLNTFAPTEPRLVFSPGMGTDLKEEKNCNLPAEPRLVFSPGMGTDLKKKNAIYPQNQDLCSPQAWEPIWKKKKLQSTHRTKTCVLPRHGNRFEREKKLQSTHRTKTCVLPRHGNQFERKKTAIYPQNQDLCSPQAWEPIWKKKKPAIYPQNQDLCSPQAWEPIWKKKKKTAIYPHPNSHACVPLNLHTPRNVHTTCVHQLMHQHTLAVHLRNLSRTTLHNGMYTRAEKFSNFR